MSKADRSAFVARLAARGIADPVIRYRELNARGHHDPYVLVLKGRGKNGTSAEIPQSFVPLWEKNGWRRAKSEA